MRFYECERCGIKREKFNGEIISCMWELPCHVTYHNFSYYKHDGIKYYVCHKCFEEWHDGGHYEMWRTFYCANNDELADKFMLDFLGRLG